MKYNLLMIGLGAILLVLIIFRFDYVKYGNIFTAEKLIELEGRIEKLEELV